MYSGCTVVDKSIKYMTSSALLATKMPFVENYTHARINREKVHFYFTI